jgi:hypothetical protein
MSHTYETTIEVERGEEMIEVTVTGKFEREDGELHLQSSSIYEPKDFELTAEEQEEADEELYEEMRYALENDYQERDR